MKKLCIFTLLTAASVTLSQAQVFQYLYGTSKPDRVHDGHTAAAGGFDGHFIAGLHSSTPNMFSATRANSAGSAIPAGAPYFSNLCQLSDVPIPPGAAGLSIQEVRSAEIPGGAGYGMAGSYIRGASSNPVGVFYQFVRPNGVLGPVTGYFFSGAAGTYNDVHVKKIITSSRTPGDMFIVGNIVEALTGYSRIFVLRINQTGGLVWSRIYRLDFSSASNTDFAFDITESRKQRNGAYELIVVGQHFKTSGGQSDGFLLRINEASGNMFNPVQFYGTAAASESFTCIKTASNSTIDPAGAGYIIGGMTNSGTAANSDFWFTAVNQAGTQTWSNTFDYNSTTGMVSNDYCRDLIEYRNSSGTYEYYLAGSTDNGNMGAEDMLVIHTDQNGNAVANGQYTYGNRDVQSCVRIDEVKTPGSTGIALYGTTFYLPQPPPLGITDMSLIKASFNGTTACDYELLNAKQSAGPGLLTTKNNDNYGTFAQYTLYSRVAGKLGEFSACAGCSAPKPPLVAHWNFTGGSLVDGANGLTGTIVGGVTPAAGLLGTPNTAFQFDGTSGYIQVPSNPVLDLQSWTLTALVQPQGFYNGTCQGNAIIWRGTQYGSDCYAMIMYDNAWDNDCYTYTPTKDVFAGFPAGFYGGATSDWLGAIPCTSNPCVNAGQWYCVWVSYDAPTGKIDVYVDGILRVSLTWPNAYGAPTIADLFIGSSNGPGGAYPYFFNGIIDDVAIFGGPLVCPLDCHDAENGLARPTTGITPKLVSSADIQAIPNPTADRIEVAMPAGWEGATLTVLNATGQELDRKSVPVSGKTTIDLSQSPAGMYLLRIQHNDKYTVKKVIRR